MSLLSEKIRVEWKENDAKRDKGLKTPEDIIRFDDLSYGPVEKWNTLDVYRPGDSKEVLPVIINIHGGGWVYGDKELYQFYGMSLAQRGFAVVNFSYRLAPENKWPAQIEDINAVVKWIFGHAEEYKLDTKHIFMVGDSAGGHLCAVYSAICTNPEYAKQFPVQVPDGFVPTAVALNCGVYAPLNGLRDESALMNDLLPEKGSEKEALWIDSLVHITEKFPPAFVMSCVGDFCLVNLPGMVEALEKNQVPFESHIYGTEEEPLYHVFHVTIQEKEGQRCNDEECAFFRTFL